MAFGVLRVNAHLIHVAVQAGDADVQVGQTLLEQVGAVVLLEHRRLVLGDGVGELLHDPLQHLDFLRVLQVGQSGVHLVLEALVCATDGVQRAALCSVRGSDVALGHALLA